MLRPLTLLALAAPPAWPQCGTSGVDLVVADLTAITVFSTSGGVTALMPGVAICNLGTAPASWSATSAAHPAVLFTLYRYATDGGRGRFEALGQSWVHHQSSALQQALCCVCTPGALQQLGAGCSTTSSASAVGQQSQLGLRVSVDPQTGAFDWPLSAPPPAGSADRRLQVASADLAVPNARYFLEAQVVSGDDAASGQRANNASYREVLVGAGPVFTYVGATVVGQPAVTVWPALDPNAAVVTSTVPGEGGTLRLGYAVTDVGDGWHAYEYVLHDLDSLAGARSFAIAIPPGVQVRGLGFVGAATHSGDPVDDAPWAASLAGGILTFATDGHAVQPLANGLRAGSAFTLRFEASAPPQPGPILVSRFRPGTPDAWIVNALAPAPVGPGAFCFGDGSGAACPCANTSAVGAGEGCRNSLGSGARLARSGLPSVSNDTFMLHGSGMPNSSVLYFQGTSAAGGGAGTIFGDGLRCAAGSVVRLGTTTNLDGASSHPGPGSLPVSVAGLVTAGATHVYQVWYRNAAAFCTASTFNLSNGIAATWVP
ncbi:MAG: hypothetical protein JNK02_02610 [Planctomycetes bacterium]|nr:hypothetical protein [Planctomycetota bacterium]